jgi:hypothetical protein
MTVDVVTPANLIDPKSGLQVYANYTTITQ